MLNSSQQFPGQILHPLCLIEAGSGEGRSFNAVSSSSAWKPGRPFSQRNVDMMCMRGRVWGILIDSIVFPVSEPHRFHRKWRLKWRWKRDPQDPQEVEAEARAGAGRSWNCATRHILKHTALLQIEATLYVHNGSNNMLISLSMLYNVYVIQHIITCVKEYVKYQ